MMETPDQKPTRSWFRFRFRTLLIVFTVLIFVVGVLSRQYAACQREAAVVEELKLLGVNVTAIPKSNSIWDQQLCGKFALPAYHVNLKYEKWNAQLKLLRELAHVHKIEGEPQGEDLSELAFLTELRCLEIYCWHTKSLKGIEGMRKLELLGLSDSDAIRNFKPLKDLENLKTSYTSWEDAGYLRVSSEVIASLKSLQHFELKGCELESVSAFSNLVHLETINIEFADEPITGFENLVNVPSLREIGLPNVPTLEDLDCFAQMPNLEKIYLYNVNSLKNIDGISNLKKLKWLRFVNCHPELNCTPLEHFKTFTKTGNVVSLNE